MMEHVKWTRPQYRPKGYVYEASAPLNDDQYALEAWERQTAGPCTRSSCSLTLERQGIGIFICPELWE